MKNKNIPWTEKYRPMDMNDIVLDETNTIFFNNIIEKKMFPNLLLYGPPGTGKTTTIINLINKYQEKNEYKNKSSIIHLNASDERGIDVIRIQINSFVNSKNFFYNGLKYIILDEVDYMTKIAQQALKSLVQDSDENIRFILICNYITKIDSTLQDQFIKLRFNIIPRKSLYNYINNINKLENLNLSSDQINNIITYYSNDIRSMVNCLQTNVHNKCLFLNNTVFEKLYKINVSKNLPAFKIAIKNIEKKYNIPILNILKEYIYFTLSFKNYNNNKIISFTKQIYFIVYNINIIYDIDLFINIVYNIINNYNK